MCIFCDIIAGPSPGSFIHQDEYCVSFMSLRPINPGQFMDIPRAHIDHFSDLPDDLAAHIMVTAQRLGRAMKAAFAAQRDALDIISSKSLVPNGAPIEIIESLIRPTKRTDLDAHAKRIRDMAG